MTHVLLVVESTLAIRWLETLMSIFVSSQALITLPRVDVLLEKTLESSISSAWPLSIATAPPLAATLDLKVES